MVLELGLERGQVFISWAGEEELSVMGMACAKALVWWERVER